MSEVLASRRSVTVVCGLSGYGKNTFVLRYLVNAPLTVRYLFDPDANPEFDATRGEFASRLQLQPATDIFSLGLSFCRGWVPFDPHTLFPGRPEDAVEFFCDWAFETAAAVPGEKAIVIDELWKYVNPQKIPAGIRSVALSGRKHRLQLFVLTQEPHRLNETLKAGVSEIVTFRLQGEKSLAWIEGNGFDADLVARLEPLHWMARNLDTAGELAGRLKV